MTVTVRYYAKLKQEAGIGAETLETGARTVAELWAQLATLHQFSLSPELVRAAQNDEYCSWDAPLAPGTEVVFMPPVAGG